MNHGTERYDVKARAGVSRVRADGSTYSRQTDEIAAAAEVWFNDLVDGMLDDSVQPTGGDQGFDVVVQRRNVFVRFDVVHAGLHRDGTPRVGRTSSLIVNCDSNKLIRSDLLVLVEGPPFNVVGAIYTARYVAVAMIRDHGFGPKFSLPAAALSPLRLFCRVRDREPGEDDYS